MNGNASAFSLGSSDFGQVVAGGCYVDKTRFLRPIVFDGAVSTLITRPRRFGKSLTLSTLKCFLEMDYADAGDTDTPQEAFRTLAVSQDSDFCRSYIGRFPVIAVSLRDIKRTNFAEALLRMASEVSREALRFSFLRDSPALAPELKAKILELFFFASAGAKPAALLACHAGGRQPPGSGACAELSLLPKSCCSHR